MIPAGKEKQRTLNQISDNTTLFCCYFLSSYSVEKGDIMIYFTGDTHFGHANIITHCNRPFLSIQEMDQAIINKWRERVTNNDTVYILGDMFFVGRVDYSDYLKMLPEKKHLIIGNHD